MLETSRPRPGLTAIWSFDLAPITQRLAARGVPNASRLEQEFRKVASLWHLHPTRDLAPSREVDEFWHEFIQDSIRYRSFCQAAFGAFLDHIPGDGTGMLAEYSTTRALYRESFGEPDAATWGALGPTSMGRLA